MAELSIVSQPPRFASAYKPMRVVVESPRAPVNTLAGESNIGIADIKAADALDVATYGNGLAVGDVFIKHSNVALGTWGVGQTVRVTQSDIPEYNGTWRILKLISDKVIVIDAEHRGNAIAGRLAKYYEGYVCIALAKMERGGSRRFNLTSGSDGYFTIDVSDFAARTFGNVFEIARGEQPPVAIKANGYITQKYQIFFSEGYMIPNEFGVNVFTEMGKGGGQVTLRESIAVNNVQPYHHMDGRTEAPDMQWMDDLDGYVMTASPRSTKFLTFAPTGNNPTAGYDQQRAARASFSEDYWLGALWSTGLADSGPDLNVIWHLSDGSNGGAYIDLPIPDCHSFLVNVGPKALEAVLPPNTVYYRVVIRNIANGTMSESRYITVDQSCDTARRMYFLNAFGAIDQYTVDGKEGMEANIKRSLVRKDYMEPNLVPTLGDYNARVYKVDIQRRRYATTRKEPVDVLRWLGNELLESPDVRTRIYDDDVAIWTPVILTTDSADMGERGGKMDLEYVFGVDNRKHRR